MIMEHFYPTASQDGNRAKKWMKLDNAANIYPAIKSPRCTAVFRLWAELTEPVDRAVLEKALENTLRRLPGFASSLKSGLFWHYLERQEGYPTICEDVNNPCGYLDIRRNKGFLFRVRCYENRISVEFFHALTDGTGGMTFLKTLVGEYLRIKQGLNISYNDTVLDCSAPPKESELENSFDSFARPVSQSRRERTAYHVRGHREPEGVMHITTGIMPLSEISALAKSYDATINELVVATLIMAFYKLQQQEKSPVQRKKPIKISIPINLRKHFPSETLRNFTSYVNLGIDPVFGEHSLPEIIAVLRHSMAVEGNKKSLGVRLSTNVASERNPALRATPLFMKNMIMRMVYVMVGDRYNSATLSNLGLVKLPEEMEEYVERFGFMLGPGQNPFGCTCVSYGDTFSFNFSRTIREPMVEREFFTLLVKMGIHVTIESNQR